MHHDTTHHPGCRKLYNKKSYTTGSQTLNLLLNNLLHTFLNPLHLPPNRAPNIQFSTPFSFLDAHLLPPPLMESRCMHIPRDRHSHGHAAKMRSVIHCTNAFSPRVYDLGDDEGSEEQLGEEGDFHVFDEGDGDRFRVGEETVQGGDAPDGGGGADRVSGDVTPAEIGPVQRDEGADRTGGDIGSKEDAAADEVVAYAAD